MPILLSRFTVEALEAVMVLTFVVLIILLVRNQELSCLIPDAEDWNISATVVQSVHQHVFRQQEIAKNVPGVVSVNDHFYDLYLTAHVLESVHSDEDSLKQRGRIREDSQDKKMREGKCGAKRMTNKRLNSSGKDAKKKKKDLLEDP
ncbi:hypothetical protein ILUMI_24689 [Ignelater luminosus]|uniref:Uncharacterized protein n=1 Tax=Ignelater luminosus TaxID=2038154 RepID=A0A8K0G0E5_IGNLU|nr:hypothetical protein ILUMI_24689 [Ignelater luminosus]